MEQPKYLYKYRSILSREDLASDRDINALFNCYAILSSCKKFKVKDPQDSKINFIGLKKKHIISLLRNCPLDRKTDFEPLLSNMSLNNDGIKWVKKVTASLFDDLVDQYSIYCFASSGVSSKMWKEYAAEDTGFCIEFKAANFDVTPVKYKSKIGEINVIYLIEQYLGILTNSDLLGRKILELLHIKLKKFKYEGEYRFINKGKSDDVLLNKEYDKNAVSSVIFGSKMPKEHKEFIIKNIPFQVLFKQAIRDKLSESKIILENYDEELHL